MREKTDTKKIKKSGGKGEMLKKWVSAIIALIFLFNSCIPSVWAREGNCGKTENWEAFAGGAMVGLVTSASCCFNPVAGAAGSITSDLVGLYMYYNHYDDYGETKWQFDLFGHEINVSNGQVWSMVGGMCAGAAAGLGTGALSGAGSGTGSGAASGAGSGATPTFGAGVGYGTLSGAGSGAGSGAASGAGSGAASGAVSGAASGAVSGVSQSFVQTVVNIAVDAIQEVLRKLWEMIKLLFTGNISTFLDKLVTMFQNLFNGTFIKDLCTTLWKNYIKPYLESWLKSINKVWEPISKAWHSMGKFFGQAGKDGIKHTVKNIWAKIVSKIKEWFSLKDLGQRFETWLATPSKNAYSGGVLKIASSMGGGYNPYVVLGRELRQILISGSWVDLIKWLGNVGIQLSKDLLRSSAKLCAQSAGEQILKDKGWDEEIAKIAASWFASKVELVTEVLVSNFVCSLSRIGKSKPSEQMKLNLNDLKNQNKEKDSNFDGKLKLGDAAKPNELRFNLGPVKKELINDYGDGLANGQPISPILTILTPTPEKALAFKLDMGMDGKVQDSRLTLNTPATNTTTSTIPSLSGTSDSTGWKVTNSGGFVRGEAAKELVLGNEFGNLKQEVETTDGLKKDLTVKEVFNSEVTVRGSDKKTTLGELARRGIDNVEKGTITDRQGNTIPASKVKLRDGSEITVLRVENNISLESFVSKNGNNTEILNAVNNYIGVLNSPAYQQYGPLMTDTKGNILIDPKGGVLNTVGDLLLIGGLPEAFSAIQNEGLSSLVAAAAKIGVLSVLRYRTYHGQEAERTYENFWKMTLADAGADLAAGSMNNWDWANSWLAGTGAIKVPGEDGEIKSIYQNPWRTRPDGMGFWSNAGVELLKQSGGALSQIVLAKYCKDRGIDAPYIAGVVHLAGSTLSSAVIDAFLRRDPGLAEQVEWKAAEKISFNLKDTESSADTDKFKFDGKLHLSDLREDSELKFKTKEDDQESLPDDFVFTGKLNLKDSERGLKLDINRNKELLFFEDPWLTLSLNPTNKINQEDLTLPEISRLSIDKITLSPEGRGEGEGDVKLHLGDLGGSEGLKFKLSPELDTPVRSTLQLKLNLPYGNRVDTLEPERKWVKASDYGYASDPILAGRLFGNGESYRDNDGNIVTKKDIERQYPSAEGYKVTSDKEGNLEAFKPDAGIGDEITTYASYRRLDAIDKVFLNGKRFINCTIEDFNNQFKQSLLNVAPFPYNFRSPGTGLNAIQGVWQNEDKFINHIDAMMQGVNPIQAMANQLGPAMISAAADNFGESFSYGIANHLWLPYEQCSFAAFIPASEIEKRKAEEHRREAKKLYELIKLVAEKDAKSSGIIEGEDLGTEIKAIKEKLKKDNDPRAKLLLAALELKGPRLLWQLDQEFQQGLEQLYPGYHTYNNGALLRIILGLGQLYNQEYHSEGKDLTESLSDCSLTREKMTEIRDQIYEETKELFDPILAAIMKQNPEIIKEIDGKYPEEIYARLKQELPQAIDTLWQEAGRLENLAFQEETTARTCGWTSWLPILGAMPQTIVLSSAAEAEKGYSGLPDIIKGGIVDYHVDSRVTSPEGFNEKDIVKLKAFLKDWIDKNPKIKKEDKQSLKKEVEESITNSVSRTYYSSAAGAAQPTDTYSNAKTLQTQLTILRETIDKAGTANTLLANTDEELSQRVDTEVAEFDKLKDKTEPFKEMIREQGLPSLDEVKDAIGKAKRQEELSESESKVLDTYNKFKDDYDKLGKYVAIVEKFVSLNYGVTAIKEQRDKLITGADPNEAVEPVKVTPEEMSRLQDFDNAMEEWWCGDRPVEEIISSREDMGGIKREMKEKWVNYERQMQKENIVQLREKGYSAITWLPTDEQSREEVIDFTTKLNSPEGNILFSNQPVLIQRITTDDFGRGVEVFDYQPKYEDGAWQSVKLDKIGRSYYGSFGFAGLAGEDWTEIALPEQWSKKETLIIAPERKDVEVVSEPAWTEIVTTPAIEIPGVTEKITIRIDLNDYIPGAKNKILREKIAKGYLNNEGITAVEKDEIIAAVKALPSDQREQLFQELDNLSIAVWRDKLGHKNFSSAKCRLNLKADLSNLTLWSATLLGMVMWGETQDNRTWKDLKKDEKINIMHGLTGFRLPIAPAYSRDGIKDDPDTLKRGPSGVPYTTSFKQPGSSADTVYLRKVRTIYLPGEKIVTPAIDCQVIEEAQTTQIEHSAKTIYQDMPAITQEIDVPRNIALGPNKFYSVNLYQTGKGESPYTGPSYRIDAADTRSGLGLHAAANYGVKQDIISEYSQFGFNAFVDILREELIGKKPDLPIPEAVRKIVEPMVKGIPENWKIYNTEGLFEAWVKAETKGQIKEFYENTPAVKEMMGVNKQGLEQYLSSDLDRVVQMQFSEYAPLNIRGSLHAFGVFNSISGYNSDGSQRFSETQNYIYDAAAIEKLRSQQINITEQQGNWLGREYYNELKVVPVAPGRFGVRAQGEREPFSAFSYKLRMFYSPEYNVLGKWGLYDRGIGENAERPIPLDNGGK